jgi:type VI secretion system protein ImpA
LEQLFEEHGTPAVLRLGELIAQLEAIDGQLGPRVRARRAALVAESLPEADPADSQPTAAGNGHHAGNGGGTTARAAGSPQAVNSRADVLRELDRICSYYDANEPTSPVPMLLRRAKRLVSMSFVEIVRELAPSGVTEIETLRGPEVTDSV